MGQVILTRMLLLSVTLHHIECFNLEIHFSDLVGIEDAVHLALNFSKNKLIFGHHIQCFGLQNLFLMIYNDALLTRRAPLMFLLEL